MRTSIDVWKLIGGQANTAPYLSRFHVWETTPRHDGRMVEAITATITFLAESPLEAREKAEAWWVAEQARQAASEVLRAKKRLSRKRRAPDAPQGDV